MNKGLREKLAELEHIQWQSWMGFMLNSFTEDSIARWKKYAKRPGGYEKT